MAMRDESRSCRIRVALCPRGGWIDVSKMYGVAVPGKLSAFWSRWYKNRFTHTGSSMQMRAA